MTAAAPVRPHLSSFDEDSFVRPVHRLVWHPVPTPLPGVRQSIAGRRLLVLGDEPALVAAVAAAARAAGAVVDEATPGHEPPAGAWDGVVDLNVTGSAYEPDAGHWRAALARTTTTIQHRYADWRAEVRADHCFYLAVTAMGGLMGYRDAGAGQPLGGIWAGFAKCLPRELPNLAVKVVDVDRTDPDSVAATVTDELSTWDLFEIGYRDGVRHALSPRRAEVGAPEFTLTEDDVVLVSGGARGVGFALADGLATEFGCRVVVTGRRALPVGADWLAADDETYDRLRAEEVAAARGAADLRATRERHRRQAEQRDVHANLASAARNGLRIQYEPCDCTDAGQVADLFARVPAPAVVVHNAGIDEPKRLDLKSADEVARTIDVKVTGFANLMREVLAPHRADTLKVFCNVGSLAGRMGGMIGQIDYAAGNEALARLGFWARDHHGLAVQTMCWPTWERLGVIANYSAAVRYVSTIAPDDAVRRWSEEIRSGGSDEVMFIGQVGAALVPNQLRGFWLFTGHPDLPRLHALAHFLGEVDEFEPFRRLRATITHRRHTHPCLDEFQVDGEPALPVSVLLEQACAVADWVVPPGWPVQHLTELRAVEIQPSRLRLTAATRFTTEAVGEQRPEGWTVTVTVHTEHGELACTLTLVYRTTPPDPFATVPAATGDRQAVATPRPPGLRWSGLVIGNPSWFARTDGTAEVALPTVTANDLWTSAFPPDHGIAPAAIEAVVRAAAGTGPLRIGRISVRPGAQRVDTLRGSADGREWLGITEGEATLRVEL
ncbi:MAG: SDR family NAD(P)-dependent oxidoreductase [Actinophytocola sp.]|uniref:SDR family NAD(P)-dependent oxidoreductase n=1 Tax=Actinophytocola sp. TaxID=1872138 RepID=UPI003C782A0B